MALHRFRCAFPLLAALSLGLTAACPPADAATVELAFRHVVAGEPVQLGSLRYLNGAEESFSVTRASWFLSGVELQGSNGLWISLTNLGWMDAEAGRDTVRFHAPGERFRALRFHVGLDAALNHADPAVFPAGHPLNPILNGLHWSWQGGYVFLALEGLWRRPGALLDGWSFHLARDTNRTPVELPVSLDAAKDTRVAIDFDLGAVLGLGSRGISFARDGSSTHSRDGDPLGAALRSNLPAAFNVSATGPLRGALASAAPPMSTDRSLDLPARFTTFPFQVGATFPLPDLPRDNPLIRERVLLGRSLFHEPLLSRDGSVSCASCHLESAGFSDARTVSLGVGGRAGTRQSMPLLNLAWKSSFFWDGRAPSLRAQALIPIQDHREMDESLPNLVAKLAAAGYAARFGNAFATAEITPGRIGLALEQFLLTLTSFDSKFDRALRGEAKLDSLEQRGLELFMAEFDPRRGVYGADCFHCHGGPLFRSQAFANNGLDSAPADPGRAAVTGSDADHGKFATPSLRNIALTAPYMHDGRFATLEEVLEHYSTGVKRCATLDPNLAKHPSGGLNLADDDKAALVAFLKTLTDNAVAPGMTR